MKRMVNVTLASLLVVACGGGGGGGGSGGVNLAGGGIGGTGITAAGSISGFGSIFVNGLRFDISSATIRKDGASIGEDNLKLGMVVQVSGTLNADGKSAVAAQVDATDAVEGPIDSVDPAAGVLVVLGQTVRVDASTILEATGGGTLSLGGLAAGNVVEVSGFRNSRGEIVATRIERSQSGFVAGTALEITGQVTAVDFGSMTLSVGGLQVDFSTAMLNDVAGGTIRNGDVVEIKGSAFAGAGRLIADSIEGVGDIRDSGHEEVEIEGLVTGFTSSTLFTVNGQAVRLSSSTRFKNGSRSDIGLDAIVEVEGTLGADGVLDVAEVKIKDMPGGAVDADTGHDGDFDAGDDDVDEPDSGAAAAVDSGSDPAPADSGSGGMIDDDVDEPDTGGGGSTTVADDGADSGGTGTATVADDGADFGDSGGSSGSTGADSG